MYVMTHGQVRSRPVKFKINHRVAPVLNLVAKVKNGTVEELVWKNDCYELDCDYRDCVDTSLVFNNKEFTEKVITVL